MLSLLNYLWYSVPNAAVSDQTVTDEETSPQTAEARYALDSGGGADYYTIAEGTVSISGEWLLVGANSAFEARATLVSGTLTAGTTGSWLALSTRREWTVAKTTLGSKACTFTVEIRRVSDSVVVDSATIILIATMALP